jgi:hypothetical protein
MIHKYSVRTSQEPHVSLTKTNLSLLCGENKISVYCESHTKHTNALCGQNAVFYFIKTGGTYKNNWALNGSKILYAIFCLPKRAQCSSKLIL